MHLTICRPSFYAKSADFASSLPTLSLRLPPRPLALSVNCPPTRVPSTSPFHRICPPPFPLLHFPLLRLSSPSPPLSLSLRLSLPPFPPHRNRTKPRSEYRRNLIKARIRNHVPPSHLRTVFLAFLSPLLPLHSFFALGTGGGRYDTGVSHKHLRCGRHIADVRVYARSSAYRIHLGVPLWFTEWNCACVEQGCSWCCGGSGVCARAGGGRGRRAVVSVVSRG
ncbi:hypothetical protein FKP32DRAFT_491586 [Trametes sanguinea]|nr:hypothetical protein FKP32DRAFT_491586 [Trametes sanguinea]